MKTEFFKQYLNDIFIETGTAGGEGINSALKAGFKQVYSIELNEETYNRARNRFHNRLKRRVHLYHGDSREILPLILKQIHQPVTFWLDAHYCGQGSAGEKGTTPLWDELQIIGRHRIKTHTILIDDVRLIRNKAEWKDFPYCTCDIEELLHIINSNYQITYSKGIADEDDRLIARVI